MKYERSLMAKWDEYAILHTAKEDAKVEGKLEVKTEVVTNLIIKLGLSDERAADVADATVEFVRKVRAGLAK